MNRVALSMFRVAVVVLGTSSVTALAAGPWQGAYVGGTVGYARSSTTVTPNTTANSFTVTSKGFAIGGMGGYSHQFGRFILGGEGEYAAMGAKGDTTTVVGGSTTRTELKLKRGYRVRGRFGVDLNRFHVFGAAGLVGARSTMDVESLSAPGQDANATARLKGWTAGAGADIAITPRLIARAEYIYDHFKGANYETSANPFFVDRITNPVVVHTLRAAFAFKF